MFKIKLFLSVITIFTLICSSAFAGTVSGVDPVVDGSLVAFALEDDYVFDRHIKSSDINKGKIKWQNTFYGKLTFKATDFLFVYGKAGITKFRTDMQLNNGISIEEDYDIGFYTGGGAKLVYEFIPRFRLAIDNQLNWWRCNVADVRYNQVHSTDQSGHLTCVEYQLSGIVGYRVDYEKLIHPVQGEVPHLYPYIGVKYAHLSMDSDVTGSGPSFSTSTPDDRKNEDKVGLVLGLDARMPSLDGFSFNIECRLLDEDAISGFIQYSF
jgi:hypothetical protein